MLSINNLLGKTVAILGLGKSGMSTAKALKKIIYLLLHGMINKIYKSKQKNLV